MVPKAENIYYQDLYRKVYRPLVINIWVEKELVLFPIEVLVPYSA